MENQLYTLIMQYHSNLIWFDGGWIKDWTAADTKRVADYIHQLDPSVIIAKRLGHRIGDYGMPAQKVPIPGQPGS